MFWRRPTRKYKIAVIDDEKEIVDIITKFLEARSYEVCSAYGGRKGLEIVRSEHPDLVILDIVMPDMDGRDTLIEIKKDVYTKSIPVIMLSAKSEPFDEDLGKNLGAADYITKPFRMKDLLRRIKLNIDKVEGGKHDN